MANMPDTLKSTSGEKEREKDDDVIGPARQFRRARGGGG